MPSTQLLHRLLPVLLVACLLLPSTPAFAQAQPSPSTLSNPAASPGFDYRLHARELAPGVYVVEGANDDFSPANGCNIINTGFLVGPSGVLVINTGPSRRYGEQLRKLIAHTTPQPVAAVLQLNMHPDYFLGNQAFPDVPRYATALTADSSAAAAKGYEDNLYRLCGDSMRGTEALLPDRNIAPGAWRVGGRDVELVELRGHTASDLVLTDRETGVVFAGGLVFANRIPTTPHAQLPQWLASLDAIERMPFSLLVPSHGTVMSAKSLPQEKRVGIVQTRRYLTWLDARLKQGAQQGLEMNDLLRLGLPPEFAAWGGGTAEYIRNIAHLYPRYEQQALQPLAPGR